MKFTEEEKNHIIALCENKQNEIKSAIKIIESESVEDFYLRLRDDSMFDFESNKKKTPIQNAREERNSAIHCFYRCNLEYKKMKDKMISNEDLSEPEILELHDMCDNRITWNEHNANDISIRDKLRNSPQYLRCVERYEKAMEKVKINQKIANQRFCVKRKKENAKGKIN